MKPFMPVEEVRKALDGANGDVKLAILLLHGLSLTEAAAALDRAEGRLRDALQQTVPQGLSHDKEASATPRARIKASQ